VALIGSEYEENLSLRYLASALEARGTRAALIAFNETSQRDDVIRAVLELEPLAVGISVPFQHRAADLLQLATSLRERGYRGHICAGGHFATFEYASILRDVPAVDSIARHEGEETLVELSARLEQGRPPAGVPGLVVREAGRLSIGEARPLPRLDALPFPDRRGRPHDVLGVRAAPIVGSRGCYADCSFCCIFAYAESARGPRYRMRSPENIVAEMKAEHDRRGVRLFVFHDDNFFLPHRPKNLERYARLGALLHEAGLREIALVIKCRPNDVDPELFALLRSLGMIRAYVGIETNSGEGIVSLNRRITAEDNRRALAVLRRLGVFYSFNVLIFDPEATLAGIETNLDFMAEQADSPFNFCRAEVYAGTPLKGLLQSQGRLLGDYMGWTYEMRDSRVELLFRIATAAFYGRNFKPDGLANLNMGIRFDNEVLRRFYPSAWDADWHEGLTRLSRRIGEDSVGRMREALAFVRGVALDDRRRITEFTLELARGVAQADLAFLADARAARRAMEARVAAAGGRPRRALGHGMPAWAAETGRLGSSTGLEASTELLPAPSRFVAPVRAGRS
jgi:methylmalonyl-CoA mutase cobalamin-binding subunit